MGSVERLETRLQELLEGVRPPTGGVPLNQIAAEAAPVLPLLGELSSSTQSADLESFEFRECLTVLTLLGRRLALLDLTPIAAVEVVQLALRAVRESSPGLSAAFVDRAMAAMFEGFVLGREERVTHVLEERAARCLRPVRIDKGAYGLFVTGVHDGAVLSECVDALGRAMLDKGVEVALVDLSQLGEATRDVTVAMFGADEVARMLGGVCFFGGVDARWETAATEAGVNLSDLQTMPDFAGALRATLVASQRQTARVSPGPLRGLVGRRQAKIC